MKVLLLVLYLEKSSDYLRLLATGLAESGWAMGFGFIAVTLASINIFGGFVVTQRMLSMFKKKQ